MQDVITQLERLRTRGRLMLLMQRIAVLLAWILGVLMALIVFDFALRLPSHLRFVLLLAGVGSLAFAAVRYLLPAIVFHPNLTELALRVERVLPGVAGRLASSVEFALAGIEKNNQLAARSVRETARRMSGESVGRVISGGRTWRDLATGIGVFTLAGGLFLVNPTTAETGISRIIAPYGQSKWPARTGVESLMHEIVRKGVHPRGEAIPLRAHVTKGALNQRVDAYYRLHVDGKFQPWEHIVLTHQGEGVHERLIDTDAESVEVYFTTDDDQTKRQRIELIPPPTIVRAALTVHPPMYAGEHVLVLEAELGQGLDDRAVTETPSLIGSRVGLQLELNKPIPSQSSGITPSTSEGWLGDTFSFKLDVPDGGSVKHPSGHNEALSKPDAETSEAAASTPQGDASWPRDFYFVPDPMDEKIWRLLWRLDHSASLEIHLQDEHGLFNADPIQYQIDAIEDRPPTVTVTEPSGDITVLPTAVVPLAAEARDDVALKRFGLNAHVQSGVADPEVVLNQTAAWEHNVVSTVPGETLQTNLDLAKMLNVSEGDVVFVSGIAKDGFELDGQIHETVRSPVRRLLVISELEFASQLRRQLGVVRQHAIRIEAMQSELQDDVLEDGVQPGVSRAQAQIAERIAEQREDVSDIEQMMQSNRLDDSQLNELLKQSRDLLDFAGQAATRAAESVEQAAEAQKQQASQAAESSDDPKDQENVSEIVEAQQDVRDELTDLITLLDRDEDTWVVKRQLEGLLESQQQLEQQTSQVGEQTLGENPENLSEAERSEIERIAQRQQELSDEAKSLIEEMRKRAKAMEQVDPQSSESMRAAADTGEQQQLDQDMEQAAERVRQNQMTSASASQQRASRTMQEMLDAIEETRQARAEELIRQLASLIESITRLITVQENELIRLGAAIEADDFTDLDRGMIRLNQNTQAVAEEARMAGQEARRIARTLDRAADAQGEAVIAFRLDDVDSESARRAEERSLELLREAKSMAEQLQEETAEEETRRQREELMDAYRTFAEQQIAVRDETLPLVAIDQLDRRQLVEARRIGAAQDDIRVGLNTLQQQTSELLDSLIFSHVHRAIDEWSSSVTDALVQGHATIDETDKQAQIAESLGHLIDALEESMTPPEEFARSQQQGGGGQSGMQQLIPPIAQLKLLRGIQTQVYNQTKELDGREDLDSLQRRSRLRDLGGRQRDLKDIGRKMLDELTGSPDGDQPMTPHAPVPERPAEPEANEDNGLPI